MLSCVKLCKTKLSQKLKRISVITDVFLITTSQPSLDLDKKFPEGQMLSPSDVGSKEFCLLDTGNVIVMS